MTECLREKSSLCCNEKGRRGAIIKLFELSNELDAPLRLHIRKNILVPDNNISTSILFDSKIPRRSTRIGEITQYDKNKFRTPPETLGKATRKKKSMKIHSLKVIGLCHLQYKLGYLSES